MKLILVGGNCDMKKNTEFRYFKSQNSLRDEGSERPMVASKFLIEIHGGGVNPDQEYKKKSGFEREQQS